MPGTMSERVRVINSVLARPFVIASGWRDGDPSEVAGERFTAFITRSRRDILRAQRLRYRVFSDAFGAALRSPFGLDRDHFDRHCLHFVVRDNRSGELVGYTRVLPSERTGMTGGFYSATEFDLGNIPSLPGRIAEIGRTCVHPDHRGGAVIGALWARLGRYMVEQDVRYLIGCASVPLVPEYDVNGILELVRSRHRAPAELRVVPRTPFSSGHGPRAGSSGALPPLLKAYLRMGARVCGEPGHDRAFNCIDLFVLMERDCLPARYLQHFLSPALAC